MNAALMKPPPAEPDTFWLPAEACKLSAETAASKITIAIATTGPQRAGLVRSALEDARRLVDGLEYLEREAQDG